MWFTEIQKHKWLLIVLVCLVAIIGFITYSFVAPKGMFSGLSKDLKAIQPETSNAYTDLSGNLVDLNEFKGKPLIINTWATWMPFSQQELPLLGKMQREYGDQIKILAINRMEQVGMVQAFLSTFAISQEVLFLLDPNDTFYKAIGGNAMPETVFYNDEGSIVYHMRGVLSEELLRRYIEESIK